MKVTYIYHSCYLLEFDDFSLIFDFYEDTKRPDGTYWVKDYLLSQPQDLYVFSTHSHHDHFNPEILLWKEQKPNIKYVFSSEIKTSHTLVDTDTVFLDKSEVFENQHLRVRAFGSTDVGGSFLVNVGGKRYFHAGDLNNWHWNEEVSLTEAKTYENNYLCELELLGESVDQIFLAMFPIDPRLGKDFMRGAEQFVDRIAVDYFLPMHFGEKYDAVNEFANYARLQNCHYLAINHKGQSFTI